MAKILICDDDMRTSRVLATLLAEAGHKTIWTGNAGEAFFLLESDGADLIILDQLIPYVDGNEMLRMLRVNPKLKTIPVVIWSGLHDAVIIAQARELGAKDYLVKSQAKWPECLRRIEACLLKKAS